MTARRDEESTLVQSFISRLDAGFSGVKDAIAEVNVKLATIDGDLERLTEKTGEVVTLREELQVVRSKVDDLEKRHERFIQRFWGVWTALTITASVGGSLFAFFSGFLE